MILHGQLWKFFLVQLVLITAASQDIDKAVLHQLGLLFGLPVNNGAVVAKEDLPSFMNSIYNCWTSDPAGDCLPGYRGKDVNVLRTFFGSEDTAPSTVPLAYNTAKMLDNSMEISFNISISTRRIDMIRYAMLRLYRRSLTTHELEIVKSKCGRDFDLHSTTLQLYTQSGTIGNLSTFSLRAVHSLSGSEFVEEEWVEFMNLTRLYKSLVDSVYSSAQRNVTFRLAVRSPCSSITPMELGFVFASAKQKPQLVEFAENYLQKEFMFSQVLSLLVPVNFQSHLSKRQILTAGSNNGGNNGGNNSSGNVLKTLPTNYKFINCDLYHYEIVFSKVNLSTIITLPTSYNANICAGYCSTTSSNLANRHSFMQALASVFYPDEVPPPCCVPNPGTLSSILTSIPDEGNGVTLRTYHDMIATECVCL